MEYGGDGGDYCTTAVILARSSSIYAGIGHTLNMAAALLLLYSSSAYSTREVSKAAALALRAPIHTNGDNCCRR